MFKIDFKKRLKEFYNAPQDKSVIVNVPAMNFLTINGKGLPDEENFQLALKTIYPVAYTLKFMMKEIDKSKDYVVMPMEVKWCLDRNYHGSKRYNWKMMFMQPDFITNNMYKDTLDILINKKKKDIPLVNDLKFEKYKEGKCAQILHVGPYGKPMDERFDILKKNMIENNIKHEPDSHDIYFNSPQRVSEDKLKTLIRVKII